VRVEEYHLGAFWGDRPESLDECARRAASCFQRLAASDSSLVRWMLDSKQFEPTEAALREALAEGQTPSARGVGVIEDLGFGTLVWNGARAEETIRVDISCGAYPGVTGLPVPNRCLMDLPRGGRTAERILRVDKLREILTAVIMSWDAEWARVTSSEMFRLVPAEPSGLFMVGWLYYLSDRYGPLPILPSEYDVCPVKGMGNIITIKTTGRFTASNPEHVEAVVRLSARLREAGKLLPTPHWDTPPTAT
jgi:hypothetical protein